MSKERQHRRSVLTKCKHCRNIVVFDWERTTADEYNDTMVSDLAQNGPLEAVSRKKRLAPLHKIKESLKRLKDETGYGVPDRKVPPLVVHMPFHDDDGTVQLDPGWEIKGEKDDKETLRADSRDNTSENKPSRVDDIQGLPSIGLMHDNVD